ncbi:BREX-1 system adenine-specific DNA-methyltransferase PglX [Bacillus sp. ISL-51]|uniref:BREX-1 system adenine-specific DNA-methyltransferase PglX n=1 Tax=Bacteria TaxID=2 RepID=UPI001BECD2B6|nr:MULTISPECIES: BREX-1 system adenine-specific DNA-methyltransferase PglX [Bacteria]MBT2572527.1 BREX-1 system adenine-specific DNA-methyltransferase PglX [Bacillus sp. ISL-51]MBT2634462.1 BREX-1 system adenine-specific DNA-methyltransferase PglX [Bacillus sp. ISL-26]MBT2711593.1 BREX-1 system adenine-specific DNA-methyltransferase PglX [Pseudomonas sp. ISL-88]
MNKSALKTFATNARRELLKKVEARAMKIGIKEDNIKKADIESSDAIFIDGRQLSKLEKAQRDRLIDRINQIGFKRVMEEVAYTWFNRFTALRFMEVNEYLPTKVRVLSSTNAGSSEPDMMKEALSLDLDLDKEYVYELKMNNNSEELFKYLIIKHCNDLNRYMPFMFETIDDYTEILFPEGLLATDSFIRQMTSTEIIPEDNWKKVEVIGWLYQYYIAEENERVIKAKKRYKPEEIPFATQLFTPEWIVRYMVQNALGRYWIESHPEHRDLINHWEFYLENPNPERDYGDKLAPYINKELNIEDIKCFDPAMGSGHILVYMFDVLFEIYIKCGYMEREIPRLIIEKNLYGLDIDDRAYQLASFSLIMKALEYNKRFLRSIERDGLKMNLASIQETNTITEEEIEFIAGESSGVSFEKVKLFVNQFKDAKAIGSLIKLESSDGIFIKERLNTIEKVQGNLFEEEIKSRIIPLFSMLIKQAKIMGDKYNVFISNPPYAANNYVTPEVANYLAKYYPDVKSDLFSAFIELSYYSTVNNGQMGFMTPFVWMFISSYEKLRKSIINSKSISSLVQLEYSGFEGATVPICTFTLRNYLSGVAGEYVKLSDFKGAKNQPIKTLEAVKDPSVSYRYSFNQSNFNKIPGSPISFWASENVIKNFGSNEKIETVSETRIGMATANNDRFMRLWYEVPFNNIGLQAESRIKAQESEKKWFPYSKGGPFRKWAGNMEFVVNWENDGYEIRNFKDEKTGRIRSHNYNLDFIFKQGLTYTAISSSKFACRYMNNSLFGSGGSGICNIDEENIPLLLAILNSKVTEYLLRLLSSTMNFEVNTVGSLPFIVDERKQSITQITQDCIYISKNDWDSFETSWNFKKHPLLQHSNGSSTIESAYKSWENYSNDQFNQLKTNEEKLNRIIIDIYGLNEEIIPDVDAKDVTIRKADLERDIKSFISYVVGCSFGRYSLDEEGIIYAGGEFDHLRYKTVKADKDNILPILPGAHFEDDIVSRFVNFIRITFGEETLSENLNFVADVLGRKKDETPKETLRRYFLNDFYKDHIKTYSKRPIYWLFTSGKEKAFNCLIYMHRYDKTTLSRIRTDYLHEYQIRLDAEKKDWLNIIDGDSSAKEISNAKKELKSLEKKIDELKAYDELLHHMADMQIEIDLDDGVKVNYEKFKGLVAKI